ncbi:E3 ubiquitin-protein ligase MARCH1 [Chionoecetes opilio]|uniref:E3 ubiquitin-protein ligase MARCH1 n=1 Tax=Chionoecetes opilio TaxID=41210 RepID=A0A8J4XZG8_CHIOP|nr:E3 ubiquitin-protein ligase MARCH1 [Chionoecetes opilio]
MMSDCTSVSDSESVAVTDLEYDAQSDTERNDAGRVYYEENEPQIVMGSYMFEPEYEVDEQVLAEPEVQQEDLAFLQIMDCGCECDEIPTATPHPHPPHAHPGLSPLSPSQPGGSGPPTPPTPGPSVVKGSVGGEMPAKVTFSFHGDDDDDDDDRCSVMNAIETASLSGSEPGDTFRDHVLHHCAGFPRVPSYSRTGVLSASSSTASMPMCRICHHPQGDGLDSLISPCRCAGTMQYIHQGCLNKWLEVKRCKKSPACELCNYQFHRHKKFRLHHWQLPSCTRADKVLHSVFLFCLVVMAACATITIICFKQDRVPPKKDDAELTKSEVVTLTCGVMFFVAFFVAIHRCRDLRVIFLRNLVGTVLLATHGSTLKTICDALTVAAAACPATAAFQQLKNSCWCWQNGHPLHVKVTFTNDPSRTRRLRDFWFYFK